MAEKYDFVCTITGVSGFVGSNLARHLLDGPYNVKVWGTDVASSHRLDNLHEDENFTFEEYDAHQPIHSDMLAVDSLYHFAGIADPERYLAEPLTVIDLNLDGLRNILERISRWKQHRPRIVYSSTSEVYGKNPDVPFNEHTSELTFGPTQKRRWCYAMTKAVGEHVLQSYGEHHGVDYTIFRFFNLVGDDVDAPGAGRVITRMVSSAVDHGVIPVTSPGTQSRCFCYTDDFVRALVLPTYMKKTTDWFRHTSQVVNLGTDEEVSMLDLANRIALILRYHGYDKLEVEVKSAEEIFGRSGYDDIPRRVPDITEIRRLFGWEPRFQLNEYLPGIVKAALGKHLASRSIGTDQLVGLERSTAGTQPLIQGSTTGKAAE